MQWMLMPFRRYADFSGRSRRMEFWMWTLFVSIVSCVIVLIGIWGAEERLFSSEEELTLYFGATLLPWVLAIFIPNLAVIVRRLHDTNRSGWNFFWGMVPVIGSFILLYFYILEGTPGPNSYGPDPKGAGPATFA